ncbi:MAG: hypothetical protein ABIG84_05760 [archaeon]
MRLLMAFALMFFLMIVPVYSYEVTVGVQSLGNEYSRGDYIISDNNGIVAGIVSRGVTKSAKVEGGYTKLTQDSPGNEFYVLFTKGTRDTFESRVGYLKDNSFEKFYSPSFGFDLKTLKNVVIKVIYDNIIISGKERLGAGNYNLLIRYERLSGNKPLISITQSS